MKRIKLYGERNTGTNYLYKLIEQNLEAKLINNRDSNFIKTIGKHPNVAGVLSELYKPFSLGWKHALPSKFFIRLHSKNKLGIICITKNPYSFLLSLHKRPYHNDHLKNLSFGDFIRSKWKTTTRENHFNNIENPIELWTIKNKAYIDLKTNIKMLPRLFTSKI